MDEQNSLKRKQAGGQEKIRAKNAKMMEMAAAGSHKLTDMFPARRQKVPATDNNVESMQVASSEVDVSIVSQLLEPENPTNDESMQIGSSEVDVRPLLEPENPTNWTNEGSVAESGENESLLVQLDSQVEKELRTVDSEDVIHNLETNVEPTPDDNTNKNIQAENNIFEIDATIDYFVPPSASILPAFLKFHPKQITDDSVIQNAFKRKNKSVRKWLTLSHENKLFCFVCMAFSKNNFSPFVKGYTNRKHIHQRVDEHELSNEHGKATQSYFSYLGNTNVDQLLMNEQLSVRTKQVANRRLVMSRIVDVVKLLGKRGLASRGSNSETIVSLEDESIDHGNFLEVVSLVSKYDKVLKEHIDKCIEERKKKESHGRGSIVTFLSKTTFNSITQTIAKLIQEEIVKQVKLAGMYSIQIDTTQDVTSQDQCSVIIRYVTDKVYERLLFVIKCDASTGEYFATKLSEELQKLLLLLKDAVGSATDGASNMRGCYKGFQAKVKILNPLHVHLWCFAHRLNLVLQKTTSTAVPSVSLFGLINDIAVFIKDSYQRMNVWDDYQTRNIPNYRHKKLSTIGDTRWWAKEAAVKKIFGELNNFESGTYLQLVAVLNEIENNDKFNNPCRYKAKTFKEGLLKYETIITSVLYLQIFKETGVLSKHLQNSNYDLVTASVLINSTSENLKLLKTKFPETVKMTSDFIEDRNEQLGEIEIEIEKEFKPARNNPNPLKKYENNVYDKIVSTVIECMDSRFSENIPLLNDLGLLHPMHFEKLCEESLPKNAFEVLSAYIIKFNERATPEVLRHEFLSLSQNWDNLKKACNFTVQNEVYDEIEDNTTLQAQKSCKGCLLCVYMFLNEYNMINETYASIATAYKYALTLSYTQVSCERSFSLLKYIKNRLRNAMSQEHLQNNLLMNIERNILVKLDNDDIIDDVAAKSNLLKNLLIE